MACFSESTDQLIIKQPTDKWKYESSEVVDDMVSTWHLWLYVDPFFQCVYSNRLHRKHIYIYIYCHCLLLDKQAFLWKSQFGPLLNMVVWGRLTSGFGARPDELGIWVWNGEIPNSLRQSQTRSLKKIYNVYFPIIIPVVPHKAVAEVSKIGNL